MKKEDSMSQLNDTRGILLLKWVLINISGLVLVAYAWHMGWVSEILAMDSLHLNKGIALFFVAAASLCAWQTVKMSRELEIARRYVALIRSDGGTTHPEYVRITSGKSRVAEYVRSIAGLSPENRYSLEHNLRSGLDNKILGVGINMTNLYSFAILVTVVGMKGFAVALVAVGGASDPKVGDILRLAMPWLDLAFTGTLLGGIFAMWLGYLYKVLIDAKELLVSALIQAGVYHASV
jgi:hypothetical protein